MQKVLKWVGIGLGGLVGVVLILAVVLYAMGRARIHRAYTVGEDFTIPASAEAVARGKLLTSSTVGCLECHAPNGAGNVFFENEAPFGTMAAPNLTTGAGGVGGMSDAEWERAVRHGIGNDGRVLIIMPSHHFAWMSDEDLGAVLAYIKSLPPVDNVLPARSLHPLLYIMGTAGMLGDLPVEMIDHQAAHPASIAPSTDAAYGEYLTHLATCYDCHGPALDGVSAGGPPADVPPPNITGGGEVGGWTLEQFQTALKTGVTPSGRTLSDEMPWKLFGQMSDDNLEAIYNYLQTLPK